MSVPKKRDAVASKTSKPLCTEKELKSLQKQLIKQPTNENLKSLKELLEESITLVEEGSHTCTLEQHLGCLCTVVCDTAHAPKLHCHL